MKTEKNYYTSHDLVEISKRGYYSEKISFIISHLSKIKKIRGHIEILDIASNDGYLANQYAAYGNVTANEINKEGIALCKKRGLACIEGDFFSIPENYHGKFDVIIAGDIVEHIFDTDAFLKKIYLLLKSGGVLILTTPNVASFGRRIMLLLGINPFLEFSTLLPYKEFNVGHIRYYTLKTLRDQLRFNHFSNIKIVGDRINVTEKVYLRNLGKLFPSLARYFLVYSEKK